MSFSWWVQDRNGNDLLGDINSQMFGLGPSGWPGDTPCPNSVEDMRRRWADYPYTDKFEGAARDAVASIQAMASQNLESLKPHHECPACACPAVVPKGWSVEDIDRLLAIDLSTVWRAGGGW